ncbi:MAG: chloramphenicol acetyltransferase [Tannerellaceae bacterium]|nr:chloramphenicol acetyltransferase [Tannerellaceae bacterium]
MKYIDIENWKRKEHFKFFYRADYPQYNICMDLDITRFLAFTKEHTFPFYYSMIYAVTKVLNEIEDFKYRIREGKVVLHDKINPSFTYINPEEEDELFKIITVDFKENIQDFIESAQQASASQKEYFDLAGTAGRDDLIYLSCIPWISFTHISHTILLNRDDSVPRISWGKYFAKDGKVFLPFSVQVHHALLDGIHVGKYIDKLQAYLNAPK